MVALTKTQASNETWAAPTHTLKRIPTLPGETEWVVDDGGVVLSVDAGVHDLLGYWPEEVVDSALWWKRIHEDDRVRIQMSLETLFASQSPFDVEFRLQRRDGVWIWAHARAAAIAIRDEMPCAHVLIADVTEKRQMERKLFQRQRRTRAVLASAPFVICWRRASGDFGPVYVSENIAALYGYAPVEVVRSSTFHARIINPDDRSHLQAALYRAAREGRAECEYRLYDKRGDVRFIRDEMVALHSRDGDALEICSFWIDLAASETRR